MLQEFVKTIKARDRSQNTIVNLDQTLGKAERYLGKPLDTATYEDLIGYINHVKDHGVPIEPDAPNWIKNREHKGLSKGSLHIIESKFIQFYKFCFDQTDDPKFNRMVRQLKSIRVDKPKSHVQPQDILLPEEAKMLINVATLERDRCLVASFFESGMRLGEMLALDNDMVGSDSVRQEITFHIPETDNEDEGGGKAKTGARSVVCVDIYGYVQDWLKCNPDKKFMPLSKNGIRKVITKLYKKAGIDKPSNVHMLRHSAITHAAGLGMTETELSYRFWGVPHSNMVATYVHMSAATKAEGYRIKKGLVKTDSGDKNRLASVCVECGRLIQSGSLCKSCADAKKNKEENAELRKEMEEMKRKMDAYFKLVGADQ